MASATLVSYLPHPSMHLTRIRTALALLLCSAPLGAQAPSARVIGNQAACPTCRIERSNSVVLRDVPRGDELVQPPSGVVTGSGDLLYELRDDAVFVYRRDGRFVRRLARSGSGPGEIRWPAELWSLPGDSMLVIDLGNQRALVFAPTGAVVRQLAFPHRLRHGIVVRWPDRVIMSGPVAAPSGAGRALHELSFAGRSATIVRSFGPTEAASPARDLALQHVFTRAGPDAWWSMAPGRYELSRWDSALRPTSTLSRTPSWMSTASPMSTGTPDSPPSARVRHVVSDRDGRLWVYAWVAAPTWREAWAGARSSGGRGETSVSRMRIDKLYNTVLDVIDPSSGALVVSTTLQGVVVGAPDADRVALYQYSLAGEPIVRVVQLRLVGVP